MKNLDNNCQVLSSENLHINEKLSQSENIIKQSMNEFDKLKDLHFETEKNLR